METTITQHNDPRITSPVTYCIPDQYIPEFLQFAHDVVYYQQDPRKKATFTIVAASIEAANGAGYHVFKLAVAPSVPEFSSGHFEITHVCTDQKGQVATSPIKFDMIPPPPPPPDPKSDPDPAAAQPIPGIAILHVGIAQSDIPSGCAPALRDGDLVNLLDGKTITVTYFAPSSEPKYDVNLSVTAK